MTLRESSTPIMNEKPENTTEETLGSETKALKWISTLPQFKNMIKTHQEKLLLKRNPPSRSKNPRVIKQAGPNPPPYMPIELENIIIKAKKGSDIKLVIQKELSPSDMKDQFARLSLPKDK